MLGSPTVPRNGYQLPGVLQPLEKFDGSRTWPSLPARPCIVARHESAARQDPVPQTRRRPRCSSKLKEHRPRELHDQASRWHRGRGIAPGQTRFDTDVRRPVGLAHRTRAHGTRIALGVDQSTSGSLWPVRFDRWQDRPNETLVVQLEEMSIADH